MDATPEPTPNSTPDTSLTERYLSATTRSLPVPAQEDVRNELRASIDEAIETRTEQGEDRQQAERAVLNGLGDPAALAASFAERPLQLIGPRYYLAWWRLLKLLLAIVPVSVFAVVVLGQSLAGAPIGQIIGQSVAAGVSVALHVCFWVTVVFAALERSGANAGTTWDVDRLPEPQETGAGRSDLVASLALLTLAAAAIAWDGILGLVRVGGESLPFLNPALWPWAVGALVVLIAAEALLAVLVHARGHWTTMLAALNTALAVLFISWVLTLLGRGILVNPALVTYLSDIGGVDQETWRVLGVLLGFTVVGVSTWDAIDGWLKAHRAAR
ncbi:MAG: permease prefix domain 1-containing protein [Pauljensenia sp.]